MGWSEYLAVTGCLTSALTYQLYQSKVKEYESLSIELNEKIKELGTSKEIKLDYNEPKAEQKELSNTDGIHEELNKLRRKSNNLAKINDELKTQSMGITHEKHRLEVEVESFRVIIQNLEADVKKSDQEKKSLKDSYRFKLNNKIETLITSRDLEIENLKQVVRSLKEENEASNKINSKLTDLTDRQIIELDAKTKQIEAAKNSGEQSHGLSEKIDELEQLNNRKEDDLKKAFEESAEQMKQISDQRDLLKKRTEELNALSKESKQHIQDSSQLKTLISKKDQNLRTLEANIAQQSKLLGMKVESLEACISSRDAFFRGYKELGCEIAKIITDIQKEKLRKSDSELGDDEYRSEEFEIVKYDEGKRSSEEFEEVNMNDSETRTSDSSDIEISHTEFYQSGIGNDAFELKSARESKHDEQNELGGTIKENLERVGIIREHIRYMRSIMEDDSTKRKNNKSLIKDLKSIIDGRDNVGPEPTMNTGNLVEGLEEQIKHTKKKLENKDVCDEQYKGEVSNRALESKIVELQLKLDLKNKIREMTTQEQHVQLLKERLTNYSNKDKEIDDLKEKMEHKHNEVAEFKQTIQQKHNETEELRKTIQQKQNEVDELHKQIEQTNTEAKSHVEKVLSKKEKEIADLENEFAKLTETNEELKRSASQVAKKNEEIETLKSNVAELSENNKEIHRLNAELQVSSKKDADLARLHSEGLTKELEKLKYGMTNLSDLDEKAKEIGTLKSQLEILPQKNKEIARLQDQIKNFSNKASHAVTLPEEDTKIASLKSGPSRAFENNKQVGLENAFLNTGMARPTSSDGQHSPENSEGSYKQQISLLTNELKEANAKIAKQHKVLTKNLELLKDSRSRSSSPICSPTKT